MLTIQYLVFVGCVTVVILVQLEHRADREVVDQVQNSGLLSTLGISGLDIANLLSHFVNGQSGVALYRCIIIT